MATVNTIALLVLVGVTASFACMHSGGDKPPRPSCENGVKCPEYTVEYMAKGYERRMYAPGMWVGTTVVGKEYGPANMEGFNTLFKYISGENDQEKKIAMTTPVLQKVMPNEDMTELTMNYTMFFYVSSEYNADGAPMPTNPNVFIKRFPMMELYAREFPGHASGEMYMEAARTLASLLQEAGEPFDCGHFATAGYDAPFKPFNRRNEVWFPKMEDGAPPARCGGGDQ